PLRAAGEPARALLADALTSGGAFGEVAGLEPDVTRVAQFQAIALRGAGRVDGALALAARLGADPQHRYLEDIAHVAFEPAGGRGRDTLDRLHATIAALERADPTRG